MPAANVTLDTLDNLELMLHHDGERTSVRVSYRLSSASRPQIGETKVLTPTLTAAQQQRIQEIYDTAHIRIQELEGLS